jgi:hypothetical protein
MLSRGVSLRNTTLSFHLCVLIILIKICVLIVFHPLALSFIDFSYSPYYCINDCSFFFFFPKKNLTQWMKLMWWLNFEFFFYWLLHVLASFNTSSFHSSLYLLDICFSKDSRIREIKTLEQKIPVLQHQHWPINPFCRHCIMIFEEVLIVLDLTCVMLLPMFVGPLVVHIITQIWETY